MASSSAFLCFSIGFLLLFHSGFAQIEQIHGSGNRIRQQHRQQFRRDCNLRNLRAQEPTNRIEAEGGSSEFFDQNDEQFECAGVAAIRHTIKARGLFLPSFANAPTIIYIIRGNGIQGAVFPGCVETYQSASESQSREQEGGRSTTSRDQHQKIRRFREGDIIALPTGIAQWIYNNGQDDIELFAVYYTAHESNQLDQNLRKFFLAGNPRQEIITGGRIQSGSQYQGRKGGPIQGNGNNLFSGFPTDIIAESLNIDENLANKLKNENDQRGHIIQIEGGLQLLGPQFQEEREEESRQERERGGRGRESTGNGIEETFCSLRLRQNIDAPERADIYTPRGGRITTANSHTLPILRHLQLSAERGILYSNGIYTPHYNQNSHSIILGTRGSARIQIVGESGNTVFDDQIREGQVLIIPQNFAAVKKASSEGFEWIAIKTNDNAIISPLAGRLSIIRSIPADVLANALDISREEARRLKNSRIEATILSPGNQSQRES